MDRTVFEQLENKYAQHASWAVWNSRDLEDTSVIRENLRDLKTSVVMVALNISRELPSAWRNFHSRDHARKLMYAFNQSPYRGAYMTDLIKAYVEPNSARLRQQLLTGHVDLPAHVATFREEMKDLGANTHTLFILFGREVTARFNRDLAETYPNRISCPHYSMYGRGYTDVQWVEKVWSLLESNSRAMATGCDAPKFFVSDEMRASLPDYRTKVLSREVTQDVTHSP
jgi:hypothetical protein